MNKTPSEKFSGREPPAAEKVSCFAEAFPVQPGETASDICAGQIPVVIPAYEPGPALIDYCRALVFSGVCAVFVVDDGSGQSYRQIFDRVRAMNRCFVFTHPVNRGKGKAIKDIFALLLQNFPDLPGCVTVDSDGQHTVEDVLKCIECFQDSPGSLVLGVRDFSGAGIPPRNRYGNLFLRWLYRNFAHISLKDTQTGLRVYPARYMQLCLEVKGDRFDFENRALIAANDRKISMIEVPIRTVYASKGEYTSHYAPVRDSLTAYGIVLSCFFRYTLSSLSASAVDLLLFYLFYSLLSPALEGFSILTATVLARIISSVYNFAVNYKLVYRSQEKVLRAVGKYFLLVAVQMAVSAASVTALSALFHVNATILKMIVDTLIFLVNYQIQKRKIF